MFAIYCVDGNWLITENGQKNGRQFVFSACKWHALQIQTKEQAQEVLKQVRSSGVLAWIVPVEALGLHCASDKMTRQESRAIVELADTLLEQNAPAYIGQSEAFQRGAWAAMCWLLSQDAGGIVLPVFTQGKNNEAQRGQSWAGSLFADLKESQRNFLERTALGLQCRKFAGVPV